MVCPNCQAAVEWQSKRLIYDGLLLANAMQSVPLSSRINGEMHTTCSNCHSVIDLDLEGGKAITVKVSPRPKVPSI